MRRLNISGENQSFGQQRRNAALVGAAIVVAFILIFVLIVHVASGRGKSDAVATTTTTSTDDGSTDTTLTTNEVGTEPDPTAAQDQEALEGNSAEGDVLTPEQLQARFSRSLSNLTDDLWTKSLTIGTAFVTADATGAGADKFASYYTDGNLNTPWIKNYDLQWVYANEDTTGVIHVTAWYTGVSLVDGSTVAQATQSVYLDKANNLAIIQNDHLAKHGVQVDPYTCCTNVVND